MSHQIVSSEEAGGDSGVVMMLVSGQALVRAESWSTRPRPAPGSGVTRSTLIRRGRGAENTNNAVHTEIKRKYFYESSAQASGTSIIAELNRELE